MIEQARQYLAAASAACSATGANRQTFHRPTLQRLQSRWNKRAGALLSGGLAIPALFVSGRLAHSYVRFDSRGRTGVVCFAQRPGLLAAAVVGAVVLTFS
jgi:hypothetical protein